MSDDQKALRIASVMILREHYRTHLAKADSAKMHTVYAKAVPVPEDLPDAMKVVELTMMESVVHEAVYHHNQAERFKKAIEAIEELDA